MRPGQNRRMRGRTRNKGPNPLTRSYESNGPDVKIRGTAQHVADKYAQLARDAQASGDPVSAESYLQHAEHYYRLIAAAQEQFRQQYGGTQRDEDGEEGDEEGGFGIPTGPNGQSDEYADMQGYGGYEPRAGNEPRPGNEPRQDRNPRFDRNDRQNRPQGQQQQPRYDRNNGGGYDRGEPRYDRQNGGEQRYDRNNGGEQRYDRQNGGEQRFDRQNGGERPNGAERQNGGERQDRQPGGDRQPNGGERYDRRPQRDGQPREPYQAREPRPEREPRGGYRGDNRQDDDREADAPALQGPGLPAFLTTPVRPAISLDDAAPAHHAGEPNGNGEADLNGARAPRRRRARKADPSGEGQQDMISPEPADGTTD